jgi:hypothetical protein
VNFTFSQVADSLNHRVWLYTAGTGMVSTAVGSGRRGCRDAAGAAVAELNYPAGLAALPGGTGILASRRPLGFDCSVS